MPNNANITLPQLSLNASGLTGEVGNSDIILPSLTLISKMYRGEPPDCLVMNTKTFAVTEYENYGFNSLTKFNGKYIAANANGIYELDNSNKDEGIYSIDAHIRSGIFDTYTDFIQRLRDAHLSYSSDGDIKIITFADEKTSREYLLTQQVNGTVHERRIKFERGIKNRFFDFKIENILGSNLEVDSLRIKLEPIISKRR